MNSSTSHNNVLNKKLFNDAIHGSIELHPLCVKIIDTPQFQRLRNLKQDGSCYFVYHTAAHNRFEHSIGVCHLAGELVRALKQRQNELNIDDKDVLCLEMAGLCHDLGHGPFSHLFEKFISKTRPNLNWRHEEASAQMIEHLVETNGLSKDFEKYDLDERDLNFIKELITLKQPVDEGSSWNYIGRARDKAFLYEIVANKRTGVDVDKWDYFRRDGNLLGIQGMFDYTRLMKCARVIDNQICFRDKEEDNLYHMFYIRRKLHSDAYQHKVVQIIDAMLLDAMIFADEHLEFRSTSGNVLTLSQVVDDMSAMTFLSDDIFNKIYSTNSTHPDMLRAKELIHRIYTRQFYLIVGSSYPNIIVESEQLLDKIVQYLEEASSQLTINDIHVLGMNLDYGMGKENPINKVRFYTKWDLTKCIKLPFENSSKMLPNNFQERTFMVVCKKSDANSVAAAKVAFQKACQALNLNMKYLYQDQYPALSAECEQL